MNAALLRRIVDARGHHVPPPEILARSTLPARDLDTIEAFGFELERHPILGVALRRPSERLCPDQIEHELGTRHIGRRVAVWNRVASTNDLASAAAQSTANAGLVVLAEEQSAGRGRRGRVWTAPPRSSLLLSVLLFPEGPLAENTWLTALGAVAVAGLVRSHTGLEARIKWPNDVRIDGKKVAGILVERGAGAVIGIGLNVNFQSHDLPEELTTTATSLRELTGGLLDRSELARELIQALDALYDRARVSGPAEVGRGWASWSEHIDRPAVVETRNGRVSGRLVGLDLSDGLTLLDDQGATRRVDHADVLAITST